MSCRSRLCGRCKADSHRAASDIAANDGADDTADRTRCADRGGCDVAGHDLANVGGGGGGYDRRVTAGRYYSGA